MSDPLSALLDDDDGSSGLFDNLPTPPPKAESPKPTIASLSPAPELLSFDASKIKIKEKKGKKQMGKKAGDSTAKVGSEGGEIDRGGFGVDVFTKDAGSAGHVGDNNVDLFGNSAALYKEGNIPGDLFDRKRLKEELVREGGAGDIASSSAFKKRSSLDELKPDEEISDLKFATGLLTREDEGEVSGLYGVSKVKQMVSTDGRTVGVVVDGEVTSEA
eukprot:CAMPEP_0118647386 /NCGR_PEP_ID=MMETSP0785-20121206/8576_1 /TAXON_ID=91992 /ORGANISM="Bolidomonas pacifica, Strain CCMP 1866" /LENGTH=216 /DNA_ID=CAMNT_0006539471 /DNA_START=76 /DNA_END=723 /DNA_ORIENTATION=-